MSVVLSEHLPLLATAPDGIQKLRGLILELAVRGKLVPQDSNDEPASELLKRIAKERAQLTGRTTREKNGLTPSSGATEWPFELPQGWEWERFGEIAEIERGGSPRPIKSFLTDAPDGLNWIKIGDTDKGGKYITSTSEKIRREGLTKTRMVHPGDFLLTNSMSFGRPYITQIEGCIHDGWLRISPPALLDKDYLYTLLSSPFVRRLFVVAAAGAVVMNLNADKVRELPIPLPPLAEQHRIVAKVDELMALCDRLEAEQTDAEVAHAKLVETLLGTLTQSTDAADLAANWQRLAEHFDTLFTTESSLDALKQTILQLAVMGKLVPQDPNDEAASELLKRIAQERARLEAEGVCKKSKLLPAVNSNTLYSLPSYWQWSALDPMVRVMDSGWSPACIETPSPSNEIWGVLKTTAVQTFQYLEQENKELPAHLQPRPECEVAAGDILITRAGPKNRVAISCLVETTRPRLMISDKIIRFHLVEGGMYERFVALCLNAGATAAYLENAKSGMAASQMNITQEKLRAAPIPICSTDEQHRIVAKVDELMALCDRLKADLAESRTRQARLSATLIESALEAA